MFFEIFKQKNKFKKDKLSFAMKVLTMNFPHLKHYTNNMNHKHGFTQRLNLKLLSS